MRGARAISTLEGFQPGASGKFTCFFGGNVWPKPRLSDRGSPSRAVSGANKPSVYKELPFRSNVLRLGEPRSGDFVHAPVGGKPCAKTPRAGDHQRHFAHPALVSVVISSSSLSLSIPHCRPRLCRQPLSVTFGRQRRIDKDERRRKRRKGLDKDGATKAGDED